MTVVLSGSTWLAKQDPQVHAEPITQFEDRSATLVEKEVEKKDKVESSQSQETDHTIKIENEYIWESISYGSIEIEYVADDQRYEGQEEIVQQGHLGEMKVEYELSYEDDVLIEKKETGKQEIISEPQATIIHYGTVSVSGNYDRDFALQILNLTNAYRQSQNLAPFIWDEALYQAAQIRAQEISQQFSHTRPDGTDWDTVHDQVMGENLAYGFRSPERVVKAWQNSPSHQENLVRDFSHMVSAVYIDDSGQVFISQLFSYR